MHNSPKRNIYKPVLPKLKIVHQPRQIASSPQRTKFIDERKLENIVEKRNFQRQLIDLVIPIHDEAQSNIMNQDFSKNDILKHYKNLPSKPTLLFEKAMKGLHPMQQQEYRKKELKKLDKKVQVLNERNPLQESWKSPFLSQPRLFYKQSDLVDLSASQEIEPNTQNVVLINENIRGFGARLRSYLDYDKHALFERQKGNPKCLFREDMVRMIKNNTTKELDLVKEWNNLINYDKLVAHATLQKPEIRLQQFGTISSISHYYSIQDFHKKKLGQTNTQQTPNSQISPQFVVKNSRQSNSSEAIDFGKSNQVLDVSEVEKGQDDVCIHKDTFLTYCQVFWDLIRKEDEIVERVVWAFCKGDLFTFSGFKHFYKLFVFNEGTLDDYIKFTYDFFMGSDRNEIPFSELQGLMRLLAFKIDGKDHSLSDQILMDIVSEIHRPQVISKETLQQLIFDDKIPPTVIVKLVFEQP